MAIALKVETNALMERKVIQLSSYVTGVLYTARINTVEVVTSVNKDGKF